MLPRPALDHFIGILLQCTRQRNGFPALRLHSYAYDSGIRSHTLVGNPIVVLLTHAGLISEAQHLFNTLAFPNECSFNSLISAYSRAGRFTSALSIFQKMWQCSMYPSRQVYISLLQACCEMKDMDKGCDIHAAISEQGLLKSDVFLRCALVDMYCKCGSLIKAQELFDTLPVRSTTTWNALVSGYVRQGHAEAALSCSDIMQFEGIPPDAVTFTCLLKGCSTINAIEKGREINADVFKRGLLETNPFIGSALIDMYSKCDMLAEAKEVFDSQLHRNVVTYTALISGYVEHECAEEALECFEKMQCDHVAPNSATYACCLRACGMIRDIEKVNQIVREVTEQRCSEKEISVGNALIDIYAKLGMLEKSKNVFDSIPFRNTITWNAMMTGYLQNGQCKNALNCFGWMQNQGIMADVVTFFCGLKGCGILRYSDKGREFHAQMVKNHLFVTESYMGHALVDMYAKCGQLIKARKMLESLPFRDIDTWNSLISAYIQEDGVEDVLTCFDEMHLDGVLPNAITFASSLKACTCVGDISKGHRMHVETVKRGFLTEDVFVGSLLVDMYAKWGMFLEARKMFDVLSVRDVVTWTILISGYEQHDCGEQALECFGKMQLAGISPNAVTYACALKACSSAGALDMGEAIHTEVDRKGLLEDVMVGSAVVDMYAKCGLLSKARNVFDALPIVNSITWNAMITGYALLGEVDKAVDILGRMMIARNDPDPVTFLSIFNACSHSGLVDEGLFCLKAMKESYSINPTLHHFTCIADLLGRAGQLDKVLAAMIETPFHLDFTVWLAILGACRKWGNAELAAHAFEHAAQCDEGKVSAYVCMRNIYADVRTLGIQGRM